MTQERKNLKEFIEENENSNKSNWKLVYEAIDKNIINEENWKNKNEIRTFVEDIQDLIECNKLNEEFNLNN